MVKSKSCDEKLYSELFLSFECIIAGNKRRLTIEFGTKLDISFKDVTNARDKLNKKAKGKEIIDYIIESHGCGEIPYTHEDVLKINRAVRNINFYVI